jgi:hypothetical protein
MVLLVSKNGHCYLPAFAQKQNVCREICTEMVNATRKVGAAALGAVLATTVTGYAAGVPLTKETMKVRAGYVVLSAATGAFARNSAQAFVFGTHAGAAISLATGDLGKIWDKAAGQGTRVQTAASRFFASGVTAAKNAKIAVESSFGKVSSSFGKLFAAAPKRVEVTATVAGKSPAAPKA